MTNEEIIRRQREHRAHIAAVPAALNHARGLLIDFNGQPLVDGEPPLDGLTAGELRTLVKEIERLQRAVKQASDDLRDEQREAHYAAASAHSEGRQEGLREGRGWE